jgi:DNA-binding transcriptional ArsR family regulator
MKRDMQLIENILSKIEESDAEFLEYSTLDIFKIFLKSNTDKTPEDVYYHISLLKDAGYVSTQSTASTEKIRLTWEGHNYLDKLRNPLLFQVSEAVY